jgi:predicted DsbA family dithiol-disulfide isomerase
VEALVWSDYLCPWCYVGLSRSAMLRRMGVEVTTLPFELHPEIPVGPEGAPNRGRSSWGAIAAECDDAGLPFNPPERVPNTRAVLEVAECVRRVWPEVFDQLEAALFRAHFADGLWLDEPAVVDGLLVGVGVEPDEVRRVVAGGEPAQWVDESMRAAGEVGVAGTPAWLIGRRFLVPGVMPPEFYERVVRKLAAAESVGPGPSEPG